MTDRPTLRRRLLLYSTPVAVMLVVVILKCVSVVLAGTAAQSDFAARDTTALGRDVAILNVLDVIEPAKTRFAAGALAVLEGRLDDAEREFALSLADTGPDSGCPARVNLELVRETLGDRAAAGFDAPGALARYLSARELVEQAPVGCFAGNSDPDPERRKVRDETAPRLDAKIAALRTAPPLPPPAAVLPPPPPPAAADSGAARPDAPLQLDPRGGDPFTRLQQILRDAAARP